MAFKRRNMFYENKKLETTESCTNKKQETTEIEQETMSKQRDPTLERDKVWRRATMQGFRREDVTRSSSPKDTEGAPDEFSLTEGTTGDQLQDRAALARKEGPCARGCCSKSGRPATPRQASPEMPFNDQQHYLYGIEEARRSTDDSKLAKRVLDVATLKAIQKYKEVVDAEMLIMEGEELAEERTHRRPPRQANIPQSTRRRPAT
ncbi:hypothetical protein AAG570_004053 [Ranatra chinensis]|uniref:Uncharacterized protein n=1 Tax=Ranatra chinensis TaxID=642074 RepID=A0ABD0YF96_9HEMI